MLLNKRSNIGKGVMLHWCRTDIRRGHSAIRARGLHYLQKEYRCRFQFVRIGQADAGTGAGSNSENNRNDLSNHPETRTGG